MGPNPNPDPSPNPNPDPNPNPKPGPNPDQVGRMQMLQSQMAAQAAFGRMEGANGNSGPVLTFDEVRHRLLQLVTCTPTRTPEP